MYITKKTLKGIKLNKRDIRNAKRMCKFIRKEIKSNRNEINIKIQGMKVEEYSDFFVRLISSLIKSYNSQCDPKYSYYGYTIPNVESIERLPGKLVTFSTEVNLF